MGKTNIEWADFTFNPWEGCAKVSPGCLHCYAETRNHRFGMDNWGKGKPRRRTSAANWKLPPKWNSSHGIDIANADDAGYGPIPRPRVFCASLADWLDEEVPIEWLADLLKLIHDTPNLNWLLLTKRPGNWRARLEDARIRFKNELVLPGGGWRSSGDGRFYHWLDDWLLLTAPENVWIGASVEDQTRADERIPELLRIPAKVRFVSVEPMLESIQLKIAGESCQCNLGIDNIGDRSCSFNDLDPSKSCSWARPRLHWVICGGESGPNKRLFDCDWGRSLMSQCKAAGVPFFFKQVDKIQPIPEDLMIREFPV